MKKPYQIETQRAVKQFEAMAAEGNPAVQMVLPMAEMMGWLRKGVGELIRQAGLQLIDLLMQEEVRELVGERSQPQAERTANRWGSEQGYCVVMGQKVPVKRPRVRTTEDTEVRLGSYEMFHRGEPLTETVWEKLMLGLSTRRYGQAVREFTEAYGLEKSAVSEHFIEASRVKLIRFDRAAAEQTAAVRVVDRCHAVYNTNGEQQRVSRVYVLTPRAISQTALSSIQGELQDRSGQVKFICGSELLELFEQHYPDYLLL